MTDKVKIGRNINTLRHKHKLSVTQFAQRIGNGKNIIYEWESGRCMPSVGALIRICRRFNVSADEMLGLK